MNAPILPHRLKEAMDDVDPGAFVLRMSDNVKGILVDYSTENEMWLVLMAKKKFYTGEDGEVPSRPGDYVVEEIKEPAEWLVLSCGGEFVLID